MDVRRGHRSLRARGRHGRSILWGLAAGLVAAAALALVSSGAGDLAAPACAASPGTSSPASSASPGAGKTILRIGVNTDDVDNMNPFIGYTELAYEVYSQNYEFLVERRPEDFLPGPDGVAQSWETSPDGLTWTFHLHKNITWQDGQPLTADDVVFTYNYIIDNQMPVFSTGTKGITKAVKVDDYTVQLITSKPKSNILRLWIPILPKHVWEQITPKAASTTFKNSTPIGSGPFQVVEWKRGSYVRMKANKDYWLGAPKVDELIYVVYKNPSTMVEDLIAGRIAAAHNVPTAEFKKLQNTPGIKAIAFTFFNWDYLNYNCYAGAGSMGNPVLKDPRFRLALDTAIDRDKLVSIAYGGEATPGTTILPPDNWRDPDYHWQPPAGTLRTFDLAKAAAMLDAAGYKDVNGDGLRDYKGKPIKLRLWALNQSIQNQSAGKLITGWFRHLGLGITFEVVDEGVYNDRIWNYSGSTYAPDFDMYLWTWYGYADPGQTLGSYTTSQIEGWNEPCWSNLQYDRAYGQQAVQLVTQQRKQYIDASQEVMYADSPQSITVYPRLLQAIDTADWTGWIFNTVGGGQAIFRSASQKSYLTVEPAVGATTSGTSSTWIWAVVGAAAAIVILVVVLLLRRGRRSEEEPA
jgi:peptide/nickel transport system substrate-binding protein